MKNRCSLLNSLSHRSGLNHACLPGSCTGGHVRVWSQATGQLMIRSHSSGNRAPDFDFVLFCFCSQAKVEDVYNKDDPFELDALLSAPSTESDRAALAATAEVVVEAWQYNLAVKPS